MEPIKKLGNFNLWWRETLYMSQNKLSHIAFFCTLFKGYKCNKLYEITPKKRFLGSPRKQISNFTGIEKTQVKSSCIRFLGCIHYVYCKWEGKDFLTDEGGVAKFFFLLTRNERLINGLK